MCSLISLHPIVEMLYFLSVLIITMFAVNPILLIIALLGGMSFFAVLEKKEGLFKILGFYVTIFIVITFTNPLFSHNGATPLFFIYDSPITLEALLYGMNIGVMLVAVISWFRCFNLVMTSDKLLYLFGKVSPKLSIVMSSALRFIPLFKLQVGRIRQIQTAMGLFSTESWTDRLRGSLRVYSALITWALENAIDTGSSMRSRGYGLKHRSQFVMYRFRYTDWIATVLLIILDIIIVISIGEGELDFKFYPGISITHLGLTQLSAYLAFGIISFLPVILEIKENVQWKYYRSKI